MTKFKIISVGVCMVAGIMASVLVQWHAQSRFDESDALLKQQDNQLAELAAENQRLSNLVAHAEQHVRTEANSALPNDRLTELEQLRAKAEALRKQTDQLTKDVAQKRRQAGTQFYSAGDFNLLDHNREINITVAGGPRADGRLNDARGLTAAIRKYADEHQGEFPPDLNPVTPYLPKPLEANSPSWVNAPLTGTNDFEIVYQGSLTDLSNIPPRRVALIRERQPWLTADGKWARVYGYADGAASIVESDDNFRSWEAQHIIPPSAAHQ